MPTRACIFACGTHVTLGRDFLFQQGPGFVGAETGGGRRGPSDPLDGH